MKFLALFALVSSLGAQPAQDYKAPIPTNLIQRVNSVWERMGKDYRIVSQDIHYRMKDGKISSVYGRLAIHCRAGFEPAVNFIFSSQLDVPETLGKQMGDDGLKPVLSLDHAIAYIGSNEVSQKVLSKMVFSALIGTCADKEQLTEPFVALSLWLTPDESTHDFSAARISKTRFDQIK